MMLGIITVTYNNAEGLKRTIRSVQEQTNKNYIHIIIDGDSKDNTEVVLSEAIHHNAFVISEPDNGIYDAMNKALFVAGKFNVSYVCFINAGDEINSKSVVQDFYNVKVRFENRDVIFAGATKVFFDDLEFNVSCSDREELSHQSVFIPLKWHLDNEYDVKFPICADRILLSKAQKDLNVVFVDFTVSNFELGGVSNYPVSLKQALKHSEELNLINNNNVFKSKIIKFKHLVRYLLVLSLPKGMYFKLMSRFWFRDAKNKDFT